MSVEGRQIAGGPKLCDLVDRPPIELELPLKKESSSLLDFMEVPDDGCFLSLGGILDGDLPPRPPPRSKNPSSSLVDCMLPPASFPRTNVGDEGASAAPTSLCFFVNAGFVDVVDRS